MKWDWIWLGLAIILAIGGFVYFNTNQSRDDGGENLNPIVVAKRQAYCRSLSGEPEERLTACLAEVAPVQLSNAARKKIDELAKTRTPFLVGRVQGYENAAKLDDKPDIRSALMSQNEANLRIAPT